MTARLTITGPGYRYHLVAPPGQVTSLADLALYGSNDIRLSCDLPPPSGSPAGKPCEIEIWDLVTGRAAKVEVIVPVGVDDVDGWARAQLPEWLGIPLSGQTGEPT